MNELPPALAALQGLPTAEAARLLNRKPETLRDWATSDKAPLKPLRVGGRLFWPAAGIVALLSGQAPQPMAATITAPTQRATVR